jgi:ABC-type cobalamin/Fe3+-siderophores transport system ATPase subunit
MTTDQENPEAVIQVRGVRNQFGAHVVHDGLDFDVYRGEILGVVGGSGTGKSVLLRTIAGLQRPAAGSVNVLGVDVLTADEDTRARLFDPFYSTKAAGAGTGLGLSVVQAVAAGHGGRVEILDTPGGGATFRLTLPITASPAAVAPAPAPALESVRIGGGLRGAR